MRNVLSLLTSASSHSKLAWSKEEMNMRDGRPFCRFALLAFCLILLTTQILGWEYNPFDTKGLRSYGMGGTEGVSPFDPSLADANPGALSLVTNRILSIRSAYSDYAWQFDFSQAPDRWRFSLFELDFAAAYVRPNFGFGVTYWRRGDRVREYAGLNEDGERVGPYRRMTNSAVLNAGYGVEVAPRLSLGFNAKGFISLCDGNDEIEEITGEPWLERTIGVSADFGALYRPADRIRLGLTLKDAFGVYPDFEIFDFWASGARARSLPRNLQLTAEVSVLRTLIVAVTASNLLRSSVPIRRLVDPNSTLLVVEEDLETEIEYHLGLEWEFATRSYVRGGAMSLESVPHLGNGERVRRWVTTLGLGFVFEGFGLNFATVFDKRDALMRELNWIYQSNEGYCYTLGVILIL
jgi:hypothetical protein